MSRGSIPPAVDESSRYTRRSVLRSERIYGVGFQSPGGVEAVRALLSRLSLPPQPSILDIGSGLGGAAFHFASALDANVLGIDPAEAMIEISRERLTPELAGRVTFSLDDVRRAKLPENHFDLVWTRDAILYVPDKDDVWRRALACLKPGGQLLVTDFCRGEARDPAVGSTFDEYVDKCHYYLQTLDDYGATLRRAGFGAVKSEDITRSFLEYLRQEKAGLLASRESFVADYSEDELEHLASRWDTKIAFCEAGLLKWAMFVTRRE